MSFPSLLGLPDSKKVCGDIWNSSVERGKGGWNPSFSKPFNNWEVDCVENFLVCLHGKRVYKDAEDRVLWIETKSSKFIVKYLYNALELDNSVSFLLRSIWNLWVQPKVSFFAWEAT
ncbi:hypothetical protein CK203_023744 [Vitis vinifera]|uniref:Reverse transcriptase zinc-binding domain-containing protein n=1 Tax=Vitis vinifera TaxID=29760 RepID=A0A438JC53_VITVI|nr:hypothetical protein CK203_023744 [Vitis vinifera]